MAQNFRWRLPVPHATGATGLRVTEIVLRFPPDAPAGGELRVALTREGVDHVVPVPVVVQDGGQLSVRGEVRQRQEIALALDPGEPDALAGPMAAWCLTTLMRRGHLAPDALQEGPPVPTPPPSAEALGAVLR